MHLIQALNKPALHIMLCYVMPSKWPPKLKPKPRAKAPKLKPRSPNSTITAPAPAPGPAPARPPRRPRSRDGGTPPTPDKSHYATTMSLTKDYKTLDTPEILGSLACSPFACSTVRLFVVLVCQQTTTYSNSTDIESFPITYPSPPQSPV